MALTHCSAQGLLASLASLCWVRHSLEVLLFASMMICAMNLLFAVTPSAGYSFSKQVKVVHDRFQLTCFLVDMV